jgi:hypothetical protein
MRKWEQRHLHGREEIDKFHGHVAPNSDTPSPDLDSLTEAELVAFTDQMGQEILDANAAVSQAERIRADAVYLRQKAAGLRLAKFGEPPKEYPVLPNYTEMFNEMLAQYPYLSPDVIRAHVSAAYPSSPVLDRPPGSGGVGRIRTFEKNDGIVQETTNERGKTHYSTEEYIYGTPGQVETWEPTEPWPGAKKDLGEGGGS